MIYQRDEGNRFALLIQDKIEASLQPVQAERCRTRAGRERSLGIYSDFQIMLCMPGFYLSKQEDLAGFDLRVSLEPLAEFLDADDSRSKYRATFLRVLSGVQI
ncbi:hypothetical protein BRAO375_740029 [Bradyrhizobium sp. ORS 375]|uniref:hypothetical protein n=1 Tax=Bradyrhizobium sp. (strain ORS 375) TaxID=566679 RepID=UPI0002407016|nr:hypothetical protein [Bradyrhizobium sp. ORS 375]CCD96746.1 hypothetical protein BRAO375_740029 [Bradyrhizobium sp. ORS 375]